MLWTRGEGTEGRDTSGDTMRTTAPEVRRGGRRGVVGAGHGSVENELEVKSRTRCEEPLQTTQAYPVRRSRVLNTRRRDAYENK